MNKRTFHRMSEFGVTKIVNADFFTAINRSIQSENSAAFRDAISRAMTGNNQEITPK